jgi:phosphatidylinositol alpha 1,6-mannosyltransferase
VLLPFVPGFNVGVPRRRLDHVLRAWAPDVVHLASPFVLGAAGAAAACRVGIPYVAVFQTDIAGFARRYGLGSAEPAIWAWLRRLHDAAARTPG